MKLEYESPEIEIFSFDVSDVVMDCGNVACSGDGMCPTHSGTCIGDVDYCVVDSIGCIMDGDCPLDGQCIMDGQCIPDATSGF